MVFHIFAKQRNEERQKTIFDMHYRRVFNTAYFVCRDTHLAQDVMQETFLKAFRQEDALDDVEHIGAWLTTIATRTAIDMMRTKRWWEIPTETEYIEGVDHAEPGSVLEQKYIRASVRDEIDRLKPTYKEVILLKYIHGMNEQEIAELLGVKIGTVKSRLHRAKKVFKKNCELNEGGMFET